MNVSQKLSLLPVAIGSLPHKSCEDAINLVFEKFELCPMWPQLGQIDRHEDMIVQYFQGFPAVDYDEKREKFFFNTESDTFYEELETFFLDYDEIVNEHNYEKLEKYAITTPYSSAILPFLDKIAGTTPDFAKGHVTGPLTWGTSVCDESGKCAFYDEVLRDVLVKGLTLKALWQIVSIKKASPSTVPIIFLDEPAMSQYGTSAFLTIERSELINSLKEISDVIKSNGALSAVHCCGKTDWAIITESDVSILNFDAFYFAKSLALYSKKIYQFLTSGHYIAWGVVPTLDAEALAEMDINTAETRFLEAIEMLYKKGVNKDLILQQSIITPSCGAGGLTEELAVKAMTLTSELSKKLKQKFLQVVSGGVL